MKLVFTGYPFAEFRTLQRLLLIADEIGFIDRPSVTFGKWGTVGRASDIRRFKTDDLPVKMSAHEAPSGPISSLYARFVERDLSNLAFIHTFSDGLANDDRFAGKFIQFGADYGGTTGRDLRQALVDDASLAHRTYSDPEKVDLLQGVSTAEGREHVFKMNLIDASISVTSAMFVAERTGLAPVADDPYMSRLLALRAADQAYTGSPQPLTPLIGLAIAQAVIPDDALDHLKIPDIFEYRQQSKDAYDAWSVEMNRLSATIEETEPDRVCERIESLIKAEIAPKMLEYKNEMISVREKLFGDLIKTITTWQVPSLSLAYLTGLNLPTALAIFAAAASPVVPSVVDYFQGRRDAARKHAVSYLIGIQKPK